MYLFLNCVVVVKYTGSFSVIFVILEMFKLYVKLYETYLSVLFGTVGALYCVATGNY